MKRGRGSPGRGQLYIDDKLTGEIDLPYTVPVILSITGGLNCGRHPGAAITNRYKPPFEFAGTISQVTVDVSGKLIKDTEAEIRAVMARQ